MAGSNPSLILSRRLLLSSSSCSQQGTRILLARPFSSSSACRNHIPALADVTPNNAAAFDAKQREFRDKSREMARKKRDQDSALVNPFRSRGSGGGGDGSAAASSSSQKAKHETGEASAAAAASPTPPPSSHSSGNTATTSSSGLGELSTHSADLGHERTSSAKQEASKRGGKLSSLIYGTKEGQEMDQDIERSFSQVLARGKYVHSIVFHTVKPDKVEEYVDLVGGWYPKIAGIEKNHVHLVGSWRTEVGDCDTFGEFCRGFSPSLSLTLWNLQR